MSATESRHEIIEEPVVPIRNQHPRNRTFSLSGLGLWPDTSINETFTDKLKKLGYKSKTYKNPVKHQYLATVGGRRRDWKEGLGITEPMGGAGMFEQMFDLGRTVVKIRPPFWVDDPDYRKMYWDAVEEFKISYAAYGLGVGPKVMAAGFIVTQEFSDNRQLLSPFIEFEKLEEVNSVQDEGEEDVCSEEKQDQLANLVFTLADAGIGMGGASPMHVMWTRGRFFLVDFGEAGGYRDDSTGTARDKALLFDAAPQLMNVAHAISKYSHIDGFWQCDNVDMLVRYAVAMMLMVPPEVGQGQIISLGDMSPDVAWDRRDDLLYSVVDGPLFNLSDAARSELLEDIQEIYPDDYPFCRLGMRLRLTGFSFRKPPAGLDLRGINWFGLGNPPSLLTMDEVKHRMGIDGRPEIRVEEKEFYGLPGDREVMLVPIGPPGPNIRVVIDNMKHLKEQMNKGDQEGAVVLDMGFVEYKIDGDDALPERQLIAFVEMGYKHATDQ